MERPEPVALRRALEVTLVPSGERAILPEGAWVSIQQVLAVKSADTRKNPLPWTRDYMYGG